MSFRIGRIELLFHMKLKSIFIEFLKPAHRMTSSCVNKYKYKNFCIIKTNFHMKYVSIWGIFKELREAIPKTDEHYEHI
jgi:hypothetical protein